MFDFRFATNKITREVDELQLNKTQEPLWKQAFCLQQGKLAIATHLQFTKLKAYAKPETINPQESIYNTCFQKNSGCIKLEANMWENTFSKVFERKTIGY